MLSPGLLSVPRFINITGQEDTELYITEESLELRLYFTTKSIGKRILYSSIKFIESESSCFFEDLYNSKTN